MTADTSKTVFISYRRSVSSFIARAIFMDLREHGYDVFMDVESIDSGAFDAIILNQIAARAHFVLILTPGTLERCAEPGDWLRREIETAMELQRNIVPLLVNGFEFNEQSRQYLTGELTELSRLNALNVPHDYFEAAMDRLRTRFLKQPLYGAIQPTPLIEEAAVQQKIDDAANQPKPTEHQMMAEHYFNQGYECDENGDYDGAIQNYSEAIRLDPQYADAYNNRGGVRFKNGDYSGAIADCTEALRLNPLNADAYNNRGIVRRNEGDYDGAIADYSKAIHLNPQFAKAYNNQGNARSDKGDYDEAIADYSKAIELDPQFAMAYNNRGAAFERKGDDYSALADYEAVLRIDPDHALARANRNKILKKMGRT